MSLFDKFFPDEYVNSIFDINYEKLYNEGKRGILFDIDNTLVPYNVENPNEDIINLFEKLKKIGFKICLVSNNNEQRVIKFNQNLKVQAVHKAAKPFTRNLKKAMQLIDSNKDNTVLIGDQIFTDVFGGNKISIKTILVVPIQEKEQWITKIKRSTEKQVLNKYLKRNNKNGNKR